MEPQPQDTIPPSAFSTAVLRQAQENPEAPPSKDLPPALLEAIHDDPEAVRPLARYYAAKLLHQQFLDSPQYTPAQLLSLTETCAKLGGMDKKPEQATSAGGQGYQLIINLGDSTETHRSITVEQKPLEVEDAPV